MKTIERFKDLKIGRLICNFLICNLLIVIALCSIFLASCLLLPASVFAQVDTAWVRRYNGPVNSSDWATAIAVDDSSNVYVTGYSAGSGTYYDYATIKYNSAGVEQWVQRYDGPGNGYDLASSIAVDGQGNVYVTGGSVVSGTSSDYATIKYNSDGVEQWVQRYNGPGNDWDGAKAIAVDNSGNVYVTGYSAGSGTYYDYATIKYDSIGDTVWVRRYNGPENGSDDAYAIAVDGLGNVYVTGYSYGSGTSSDYATIKYNSAGVQQWVQRYNGPGNSRDDAYAIALDSSDNVYVTGRSYSSGTFEDYATIKYNSSGVQQWVQRYNGPGNETDEVYAIAVDNSGNVYVTGFSLGSGTFWDYATIKYVQIPLPLYSWNEIEDIQIQGSGKYVKDGGALCAVSGTKDGDFLYALRGNKSNEFYKYTIGYPGNWTLMESIPFGVKWPDVNVINKKRIGKGGALCYNGTNTIYATKGNGTFEFLAYDISADTWTHKAYIPSAKGLKGGTSIAYKDGKVYLMAGAQKKDNTKNFFAYNPIQDTWITLTGAPLAPPATGKAKPFKDGSTISIIGNTIYTLKGGDKFNFFYAYDIAGDTLNGTPWTEMESIPRVHPQLGKKNKVGDGGAMTTDGSVLYAIKGKGKQDFWSYSPISKGVWIPLDTIPRLNGNKKSVPKTGAALAYANGKVWLLKGNNTPEFWQYTPDTNTTLRSQVALSGVMTEKTSSLYPFLLYQNSPNPFSSQTLICYSLPREGRASLSIYDVSGLLVKTLVNANMRPGIYNINWNGDDGQGKKLCQGVYFFTLKVDGQKLQRKMLMLR